MCNFSQILVGVPLFGQGVLASIAMTDNLGIVATIGSRDLKLESLTLGGTLNQSTLDLKTCANISLGNFIVALNFLCNDNLFIIKKMSSLPASP